MAAHDGFDEAAFRRAMPSDLWATRTPGAFEIPLPRPGFEPGASGGDGVVAGACSPAPNDGCAVAARGGAAIHPG
jgi:hypothetical protein